jgi:hypothetical protein
MANPSSTASRQFVSDVIAEIGYSTAIKGDPSFNTNVSVIGGLQSPRNKE